MQVDKPTLKVRSSLESRWDSQFKLLRQKLSSLKLQLKIMVISTGYLIATHFWTPMVKWGDPIKKMAIVEQGQSSIGWIHTTHPLDHNCLESVTQTIRLTWAFLHDDKRNLVLFNTDVYTWSWGATDRNIKLPSLNMSLRAKWCSFRQVIRIPSGKDKCFLHKD